MRVRSKWIVAAAACLAFGARASVGVADDPSYVPSRGVDRLRDVLAQLAGERGASVPDAERRTLEARARRLLEAEEAQRTGQSPMAAFVAGSNARAKALEEEGARLQARADALRANRSRTAEEVDALRRDVADHRRRRDEHAEAARSLQERVRATNNIHESAIAGVTGDILDALHANFVLAPSSRPEREFARPEDLTSVAKRLAADPNFAPQPQADGTVRTFCNFFVQALAADAFGYRGFGGLVANAMVEKMVRGDDGWTAVHDPVAAPADLAEDRFAANMARAQALANAGLLVVAAFQNPDPKSSGHVATVVPGELQSSGGSWGRRQVPTIAQAGKTVFTGKPLDVGFGDRRSAVRIYARQPKGPPVLEGPSQPPSGGPPTSGAR